MAAFLTAVGLSILTSLLVVDGTWSQARTMARQLAGVTRVHVSEGAGESLVLHRKQPRLGHVSTLAAVVRMGATCQWDDESTFYAFTQALDHNRRDVIRCFCTPKDKGGGSGRGGGAKAPPENQQQ